MQGIQRTTGRYGAPQVQDRQAGGRRQQEQADAFRRALTEHGEEPAPAAPVAPELQRRRPVSRREPSEAHHVDVVA
ncbi:MAG: hypothetical protein ACON4Z_10060 [Planctomycetota bacterium]